MTKILCKKAHVSGFTLIDLMITVAIIAILVALAIPSYQDYVARSQVAEGINLADGAKSMVAEYYANHGAYPETPEAAGYTSVAGKYISGTTIDSTGKITATFNSDANSNITNQTISLIPETQSSGNLAWSCSSSINQRFLPSSCSQVASSDSGTGTTFNPAFIGAYFDGAVVYTNGILTSSGKVIPGTLTTNGYSYNVSSLYGSTGPFVDKNGFTLQYNSVLVDSNQNLVIAGNFAIPGVTGTLTTNYFKNSPVSYAEYKLNTSTGTIDAMIPDYGSGSLPSYLTGNNLSVASTYVATVQGIVRQMAGNNDVDYLSAYTAAKTNYVNMLKQVQNSGTTLSLADQQILKSIS